jgi:hypothetical protein
MAETPDAESRALPNGIEAAAREADERRERIADSDGHLLRCQRDVNQRPKPTATRGRERQPQSAESAASRNQPQPFAPKW